MSAVASDLIVLPMEQAAKLAGVPRYRLRYWDATKLVQPGISRRLSDRHHVRLYTFADLASLLVIGELRRRGVPARQVRRAVLHLRKLGIDQAAQLATAGREVYFQYPDGEWRGAWSGSGDPGQIVFDKVIPLEPIHARIMQALRRSPDTHGKVTRRRRVHGGKLIIEGTRMPVATIVEWLDHGFGVAEILDAYPDLVEEDIKAARRHAAAAA